MKKIPWSIFGLICIASVLAAIIGIVVYPRARWLFVLLVVGVAVIVLAIPTGKGPTPAEVAERAESLLNGNDGGWDVDGYEHLNPKHDRL